MVTRRLDPSERQALNSGCVYAWEERDPQSGATGLGIERFTEGRRWSPSRVRDEFLFYYEKFASYTDHVQHTLSAATNPPRNWDPFVKQTYSVWADTHKGRRKWHLTAYFTQSTVDDLGTIDDIPGVKDLLVPPGLFKSTRVTRSRSKCEGRYTRSSNQSSKSSMGSHTYAPFFSLRNQYPNEYSVASNTTKTSNQHPSHYPLVSSFPPHKSSCTDQTSSSLTDGILTLPPKEQLKPSPDYLYPGSRPLDTISPTKKLPFCVHSPDNTNSTSHSSMNKSSGIRLPSLYAPSDRDSHPSPSESSSNSLQNAEQEEPSTSYKVCHPYQKSEFVSFSTEERPPSYALPLESSFELLSYSSPSSLEKRTSIGCDRDLASIHALTRRHPYRRDPLDDRALRLLPL